MEHPIPKGGWLNRPLRLRFAVLIILFECAVVLALTSHVITGTPEQGPLTLNMIAAAMLPAPAPAPSGLRQKSAEKQHVADAAVLENPSMPDLAVRMRDLYNRGGAASPPPAPPPQAASNDMSSMPDLAVRTRDLYNRGGAAPPPPAPPPQAASSLPSIDVQMLAPDKEHVLPTSPAPSPQVEVDSPPEKICVVKAKNAVSIDTVSAPCWYSSGPGPSLDVDLFPHYYPVKQDVGLPTDTEEDEKPEQGVNVITAP